MQIPIQKVSKQIARFFPYLVILILLLLLNRQCQETENVYSFYENEKQEVEYYKNKLGTLTASVTASELSNKQLKELILKKNDTLKKLASEFRQIRTVTKIKEVVKIDTVKVPFEVQIPFEFERLGRYDTDSHFTFNYSLNQTGFSLSDISVPNTQTIITGTKRKWVFGKQYLTTDITNTNPYIHTTQIQSVVIPVQVEWYNNKWLYLGVGIGTGVLIAK